MGNLHRVVVPEATVLDPLFDWLKTTPNPQYQGRKIDLWLPPPKLFCQISPWNLSVFKGLQQKLIISLRILLYYS